MWWWVVGITILVVVLVVCSSGFPRSTHTRGSASTPKRASRSISCNFATVAARATTQAREESVRLARLGADNDTVKMLAKNPDLRELDLSFNPCVTEVWPLKNCKKLRWLNLEYTGVEWCPATLVHCKQLKWLNLSGTKVHMETVEKIMLACPGIHIELNNCTNV